MILLYFIRTHVRALQTSFYGFTPRRDNVSSVDVRRTEKNREKRKLIYNDSGLRDVCDFTRRYRTNAMRKKHVLYVLVFRDETRDANRFLRFTL